MKTGREKLTKQELDILAALLEEPFVNQRHLAEAAGCSLGAVNRSLKDLLARGFLTEENNLTEKARHFAEGRAPRNAVILAAGYGMRMVPINRECPKALLEVRGEALIVRLIRQLREAGVRDITVVVGFMKERFDFLIDEFGVELAVNPSYGGKNNLSSLALAAEKLGNTYLLPADLWCRDNPFRRHELYSWYMVSDRKDGESDLRVNRKAELVRTSGEEEGNAMVGIAYVTKEDGAELRRRILELNASGRHDHDFWEAALYEGEKLSVLARVVPDVQVVEINTYEELRDLDGESNHLKSDALEAIGQVFGASTAEIRDIRVLKKGMTNRSFLFSLRGEKYIMRIPGEGTDQLINREQEAAVFRAISGLGICDDPVYINPSNGYKITRYLEGVRCCDPDDVRDLERCMDKLRSFHDLGLQVSHTFDIFGEIEFYESLWNGEKSVYQDYRETKARVLSLRQRIEALPRKCCLTHIDAVPDNFLFHPLPDGGEGLQLTDWEYAGMQDPHVDVAMFCIYSLYNKEQVDRLIDIYFRGSCDEATRRKIYCYIAACGLLWSNWCEYKRSLGVEFGEYSLRQYRFAKDYYRYATEETDKKTGGEQ